MKKSKTAATSKNLLQKISSKLSSYKYIHSGKFFIKLLTSYFIIVSVCILSMGIALCNLVSNNIKYESIKSNDRVLQQLKNTVDSLILNNINDISLILLEDTRTDPYVSYYLSNDFNSNIYDMSRVMDYCSTLKSINPMIFSVGIYFNNNNLYISSDSASSPYYGKMSHEEYFKYYSDLVQSRPDITFWSTTAGYKNKINIENENAYNVIHMVRKIQNKGSIVITLDENIFYNSIKKTASETLDKIIICDENGTIVSNTNKENIGKNITSFEFGNDIVNSSEFSASKIISLDGVPSAVSFTSSGYNNWKYITITPMEKINETVGNLLKIIILVTTITFVFGILISLIPSTRLSHPLSILAKFCGGLNKKLPAQYKNEYSFIQYTLEDLSLTMEDQKQKFADILPVLRDTFLQDLISNQYGTTQEIQDRMRLIEFNFPFDKFCLLAVNFENPQIDSELINMYKMEDVASFLEENLNNSSCISLHCEKDNSLAVIINFNIDLDELYNLINSIIKKSSVEIFLGVGTVAENLCNIGDSYNAAVTALKYHFIFPQKHMIFYDDIFEADAQQSPVDKALLNDFASSISAHDEVKTSQDLKLIISAVKSGESSYSQVIDALLLCTSTVCAAAERSGISLDDILGDNSDIKTQLEKLDNINEFEVWIGCLISYLFDAVNNLHSDINSQMVQDAKKCIAENIKNKQLSLQFVAKELFISSSHLSRIFKIETNVTFIDYIINLRLDYCKDFLLTTTLKIEEISSIMGYSTPQYFISRFKLAYGLTPKDYRRKYAGKDNNKTE